MDTTETETVERNGHTYRIALYHDADAASPLDESDEMGTILSLNRRQANFDPAGIEAAIADPDAVPLSYYEHGLCMWTVAGELPASGQCPWDSVEFAGLWLPDELTMEAASSYGGWTRRQFMRKRARQACEVYTHWCNGEVYGYQLIRICPCDACGGEIAQIIDNARGIYGRDVCLAEAMSMIASSSESLEVSANQDYQIHGKDAL